MIENISNKEETLEYFKSICKTLDWSKLDSFRLSGVPSYACIIFITALVQAKHPDENYRNDHGINGWDAMLSNFPKSYQGSVNICDFYEAFDLADFFLKDSDHNPEQVQEIIRNYVIDNKINLGGLLNKKDTGISDEMIKAITKTFGDMTITNEEKKLFELRAKIAKSTVERKKMRREELRLLASIKIDQLFDLVMGACQMHERSVTLDSYDEKSEEIYKQAKGSSAIRHAKHINDLNETSIIFKKEITAKQVRMFADKLNELGLKVRYCCIKSYFGQQLFIVSSSPLKEVVKKLDDALIGKNIHKDTKKRSNTCL